MPLWGATEDMTCTCGGLLGHVGWAGCFPRGAHRLVCQPCQHGNHLACRNGTCPCVHVATKKPPKNAPTERTAAA